MTAATTSPSPQSTTADYVLVEEETHENAAEVSRPAQDITTPDCALKAQTMDRGISPLQPQQDKGMERSLSEDDDDDDWFKSASESQNQYLCCCCPEDDCLYNCPSYYCDANAQLFCTQCLCAPFHYGCDAAGCGACCEVGICCDTCLHGCLHCCCGICGASV